MRTLAHLLLFTAALATAAGTAAGQTTFSLDKAVYEPDDFIIASWTDGPGAPTDWVGIYPRGVVPDGDPASTLWWYVNGTQSASESIPDGSVEFDALQLTPGEWSAHFLANDGYTPITDAVDFVVTGVPETAIASFSASHQFIDDGVPVRLSWEIVVGDLPVESLTVEDGAGVTDVLGLEFLDVSPTENSEYLLWLNDFDFASVKVFKDPGNTAEFSLDELAYEDGEPTTVSWSGALGNPDSWVGIYTAGDTPQTNPSTAWNYLNGTQEPGDFITDGSMQFTLPAGDYFACLFEDEGYIIEQGPVRFSVGGVGPEPETRFTTSSFRLRHATSSEAYTATIGAHARTGVPGGITFSKAAGPPWLTISPDGSLSGTPSPADAGLNEFTARVADQAGGTDEATFTVPVFLPGEADVPVLKVLSFNVWVGTTQVSDGYNKGLDSIILSDADIVAVSENNGRAAQWAEALGWYAYERGTDNAVLSRYPIGDGYVAPNAVGALVHITDNPARALNFWGCHLTAYPYGPYDARDTAGTDEAKVTAALRAESASGRLSQINGILTQASGQLDAADSTPLMLLGDFNCPSHLDWTPATAGADLHFGLVVDWPVTRATDAAGLTDAFRAVHPDPVVSPGDTWTPIDPADVQDRIDMVHFKGAPLTVTDCQVFTTIPSGRWPSDHAGVLATFYIDPVDADGDGLGDAWENRHFGGTAAEDAGGNPDGDLFLNFAERALGLDPRSKHDPVPTRAATDGGDRLFSYRRIAGGWSDGDSYTAGGIRYTVELSVDGGPWGPAGTNLSPAGEPAALDGGIEEASFALELPGDATCLARVRIESTIAP